MAYQNEFNSRRAIARKAGALALEIREGSLGVETKSMNPGDYCRPRLREAHRGELRRAFRRTGCWEKKRGA